MTQPHIVIKVCTTNQMFKDVQSLHRAIWGLDDLEVTPTHIYMAAYHVGGQILCAYIEDQPVGYVFGFPGVEESGEPYFYSHNLGVLEGWRNQGIAIALKVKLREVLLEAGMAKVKWTYEPLDSKNAYAYIEKLGGISNRYHREYYGEMADDINRGLPSDRLVIDWLIDSKHVAEKISGESFETSLEDVNSSLLLNAIEFDDDNFPQPIDRQIDISAALQKGNHHFYLEIPSNFHKLKERSSGGVLQWRLHVRKLLEECFANQLHITDAIYEQHRFLYILDSIDSITD